MSGYVGVLKGFPTCLSCIFWRTVNLGRFIDAANGFLRESPEGSEILDSIAVGESELRNKMGQIGHELVRDNFLMAYHLKNWLLVLYGKKHRSFERSPHD